MVDEIKAKMQEEAKQLPLFAVDVTPKQVSPWRPATDAVEVALFGKALEELGELTAIVSRCLIQGVNEREPSTGKLNKSALAEEIADVLAMCEVIMYFNGIKQSHMDRRIKVKRDNFHKWIGLIVEGER